MFPIRFSRLAQRCVCALVLTLCSQLALAQEPNPGIVEFTPSPDHAVSTAAGVPLVDQYIMTLFRVGQPAALESLGIGKPALDSDGMIRVDVQTFLASKLLRGVSYQVRVAASGPGGVGASELSNQFQYVACSAVLSQTAALLEPTGGGTTLSVTTPGGCAWTATSNVPWITVTTGAAATGSATVIVNTAINPLLTRRTGVVTIAGQPFTVTQEGSPCTTTLSSSSLEILPSGGSGSVAVTSQTGCAWTTTSSQTWLAVNSGQSGSGAGSVSFSAAPNATETRRSATLTIGGKPFTVSQDTSVCGFTITSPGATPFAQVGVSGAALYTWEAASTDPRAMARVAIGSSLKSAWYGATFALDINIADTLPHQVAIYIADYDSSNRQQRFDVRDAQGTLLDSRTASGYAGGQYLVWTMQGRVTVQVTAVSGPNAVVSGVLVGPGAGATGAGTASATFVTTDLTTQGAWHGVYGGRGHAIADDATSQWLPADATSSSIDVSGPSACVWTAISADSWLTVTSGPVTGNGPALFSAAANAGADRSTTLTVGTKTFTVTQAGKSGTSCSPSVSPTSLPLAVAGGSSSIAVTSGSGCAWTATSSAPAWLTVTSSPSGSGNGTVGVTATANTGSTVRTATLTIAGQTVTVTQPGATVVPCVFTLSATTQALPTAAGSASISVASGAGCAWTAASGATWLTVTAGASGTGAGTVSFSAAANAGAARVGVVTIAGQTVTVTQAGAPCAFTLSATTQAVPAAAGSASISVASGAGCAWTAASGATWLTVTAGASGSGAGTVSFSTAANIGAARVGVVTIVGQTVTVTQAGVPCAPTLSATSQALPAAGGAGSVTVSAGAACGWTAASSDAWMTVTGGASGTGPGTVSFSAAANSGDAARSAVATIAGQAFTVTQPARTTPAPACSVTLGSPSDSPFALVSLADAGLYTWDAASVDPRAIQRSLTGQVMSAWYGSAFSLNINIVDSQPHQVAIYVADYDPWNRQQRFDVRDAQGTLLDTRSVSAFSGGQYLVWTMQGRITVTVTAVSGPNAVVSGVLIGPATGVSGPGGTAATFVKTDLTTLGAWQGVYGSFGFAIADDVTSQLLPAAATASAVVVTPEAACPWTATSPVPWLTVTTGSGTGPGSVLFSAAANTGVGRSTTLTVAGKTFTVAQGGAAATAPPCVTSVSPASVSLPAAGGPASLAVTSGCAWTATSSATWLTIGTGASGTGNGTVGLTATANTTPTARTATVTIAGQTVTLTQPGVPCSYTVASLTQTFTGAAATGNVTINSPTGCAWTAVSGVTWLTVTSGASGTGLGTATFSVAANTASTPRTGTLTVAGRAVTVTQGAAPCTYALSSTGRSFPFGGGSGAVIVLAAAGCPWTATSNAAWLTVSSGASGTGNGSVGYTAAANTNVVRSAILTAAGKTFTVTQVSSSSCTVTLTQTARSVNNKLTTGSFGVTPSAGCVWSATSSAAWLQVTSVNTATGVVSYTVAANPTGAARVTTIAVGNSLFTLTQRSDASPNAPDGLRVISGG